MTNPNPETQREQSSRRRSRRLLLQRTALATGSTLLLGIVGGLWWLWDFVETDLAPLVQQNLTQSFKRPVQLGRVKQFSLTSVRFDSSAIPATPTDPDRLTVAGVDVGFDPWQLVVNRRLKLNVSLINPNVYVEQDAEGRWVSTALPQPGKQPTAIKTELETIRFFNGNLVLVPNRQIQAGGSGGQLTGEQGENINLKPQIPNPKLLAADSSVTFLRVDGLTQFRENNRLISYEVRSQTKTNGTLALQGSSRPQQREHNLQIQGQNLFAPDITRIIKLPLQLRTGAVNGNLAIQIRPEQDPLLQGTVGLQNVTTQINRLPQPFFNAQGIVSFSGTQIKLNNIATSYGTVPLIANGILDTNNGYNLTGRVNAVTVDNLQQTLNLKLPLPVSGDIQADVRLTGKASKPILSGSGATIKTAKIDKVDFQSLSSSFVYSPTDALITFQDIKGKAAVGGEVTGTGTVKLGKNPNVNFNLAVQNISGDAVANLYNAQPNFQIGAVAATANLSGAPGDVQTVVQWQAPQATYPGRGEVTVTPNRSVLFRNVALSVGGGVARLNGSWAQGRWQANAQTSRVQIARFLSPEQAKNPALQQAQFNGGVLLSGTTEPFQIAAIRTQDARVNIAGGTVAIANLQLGDKRFAAQLQANGVQISRLATELPPALRGGAVSGTFQVAGDRENFSIQTLQANGQGRLNLNGGTLGASNIQVANGRFRAQVQTNDLPLQQLAQVPPQLQGRLDSNLAVAGPLESVTLPAIQVTGRARLNVGGGTVTATNIVVNQGRFQAQVQTNDLPLQQLAQVPPQLRGRLNSNLTVAGPVESTTLQDIQASGRARLNVGGGTVTAANIQVNQGRFRAQVETDDVPLQRLAQVPPQFYGNLNSRLALSGNLAALQPENIQVTGKARLNVAGGTVNATNIQVDKGEFTALLDAAKVQLKQFSEQLRGRLDGRLQVAGKVGALNLANIQAAGEVNLSQGVAVVQQPLRADVVWNGEQLIVQNAEAEGLSASGSIATEPGKNNVPEVTALNLRVNAKNYNLADLPFAIPRLDIAGRADFDGTITGRLPQPNVVGQVAVRDLKVNNIAFEPELAGNIQSNSGQGLNLNVAGKQDRIQVSLDGNNRPLNFTVQRGEAIATGTGQGNNLAVNVTNFPLAVLDLRLPETVLGSGVATGLVSGNLQVNQANNSFAGNVRVENPVIGRITGKEFTGEFSYVNDTLTVANSEFLACNTFGNRRPNQPIVCNTRYSLRGGVFALTPKGPRLEGTLAVKQGEIQDVLAALQLFELQDFRRGIAQPSYGDKRAVTTDAIAVSQEDLLTQLRRFSEIRALLAQQVQQRRDASPLPDLADLKGTFDGTVTLNVGAEAGLKAEFEIDGQNFAWGRTDEPDRFYPAQKITARGNYDNGVLTLLPLRIEQNNRLIAFTGTIGGNDQSGQLRVENFPIDRLNNLVRLLNNSVRFPVGVSGNLNATATIAGSIANPRAIGELRLTDGTLNKKQVESAVGSFVYNDARLNFNSEVLVSGTQPVKIDGSFPYQLPIASVAPTSNDISLNLDVQNEGLAALNLLTDQVAYQSGQGEVNLQVRGTRSQPIVTGTAKVANATFTAQALPGPLTDVTGEVKFDFDRLVIVDQVRGQFSQGTVVAQGEIPLTNTPDSQPQNPLTVQLDRLALNLKGLYRGGASGNVNITGSVLSPIIGGQVLLSNGQVALGETTGEATAAATPVNNAGEETQTPPATGGTAGTRGYTRFNNLQIELGDRVEVTREPILNFRATGILALNGSLGAPQPRGIIRLRSGGVNLFTTQFVLARGYDQQATFTPERGLDPELDIRLVATVPEVFRRAVPNSPLSSSEVDDNVIGELGALQTVRVQARVQGLASQLDQNIQLTSSPTRSQTEIVGLLGGGFVQTLGRGDSTLGLANLAGSAFLGNIQGPITQLGNAFGLSELRLFPTIIPGDDDRRGGSTFGLAAEAGIDLSRNFSASISKILTTSQPTQFGLNYRVNDNLRVRTSTDFFGDSRAIVEYEGRF